MSEIQITNGLNIRIHKFETLPEEEKDERGKETGKIVMRDYVHYGPPSAMDRSVTVARVDRVLSARKPNDGDANMAARSAWLRAQYIKPSYEAWKKGEELPEQGTPIAALNFLRADDVIVLKRSAIRTVEELATVLDANIDAIKLPGMREKREQAKRFLVAQDANQAAARIAAAESSAADTARELAEVKAQMAELLKAHNVSQPENIEPEVDENGDKIPKRRGPGRPPKSETAGQEAA